MCLYIYKPYTYHNKPHGHLLIKVSKNEYPKKLFINKIEISVPKRKKTKKKYNLTLCICHTINYTAVRRVIQTIESYKFYGVDHFDIYVTTVSRGVYRVLKYYEMTRDIDIIIWNKTLEYSLNSITNGQIFKTNDCLYRNMHRSKALIIADWDEIIIPVNENNILDMITTNFDNKFNWYSFTSFTFREEFYKGYDYDRNIPDTDIYQHRKYCICKKGLIVKNIYTNLLGLYEIEVHFANDFSSLMHNIKVEPNVGYIRHTRRVNSRILSYCNSSWMIYPHDKREDIIHHNCLFVMNKLNI